MPGKEGGSHDDSWAFGDRRFIFSPVCLLWSCHLQSCLGPLQAWSCQARQRQTRGKKKKKDLLEGPAAVHSRARSGDSSRVSWA